MLTFCSLKMNRVHSNTNVYKPTLVEVIGSVSSLLQNFSLCPVPRRDWEIRIRTISRGGRFLYIL